MFKSFKTELNPTQEQKNIINKTIGTCRYVYNFYLAHNKELYEKDKSFMTGKSFSVWLNNEYIPNNPDKAWIKEVYSKAVKKSIENGYDAFKRFFKRQNNYPKFKSKYKSDVKMYFVKNNKYDCICERHRIKIPTLGWVRLKEKGYIPTTNDGFEIRSGTITYKADRYYISVVIDMPNIKFNNNIDYKQGIGIDLGIKDFAILSNGTIYKNINKTSRMIRLNKSLNREQKKLSRKIKMINKTKSTLKNIEKQKSKIYKIYQAITNIRTDYINKVINEIIKTNPSYITIEDLHVSEMRKNKLLRNSIVSQKFYEFKYKLISKCKENGIELRIVDRWYPSSKICHCCGAIKKDLKLSDRIYRCECGYVEDRDLNAALNLRDAKTYEIAT